MAANNFKPFATGNSANVTAQTEYEALAALSTGFQSGKASSAQINKALRQSTFIAAAVAQYVSDLAGVDALDNGDLPGFVASMKSALKNGAIGRLMGAPVDFTASGTYTPSAGVKFIIVEVTAGGGPGGSTPATGSNQVAAGAGGGAGGTAISLLLISGITATVAVTVGKGGVPNTAANGSAGNPSSFGSYLSATGGAYGANATAVTQGNNQMTYNGGGGDGTGGNLENIRGGCGVAGFVLTYGYEAGEGGRSHICAGGPSIITVGTTTPGNPGRRGSGGSGAFAGNSAAATLGGNGGDGLVRIWEFA